MYDMYPEWGPSRHRLDQDSPAASGASAGSTGSDSVLAGVQAGLDLRDHGGQRPDDN